MDYFISDKKKLEQIDVILGSTLIIYMLKGVIAYRMVMKSSKKNKAIIKSILEKNPKIDEDINALFVELKEKALNKNSLQEQIDNGIYSNIKTIKNFSSYYSRIHFLNKIHKLYQGLSKEALSKPEKGIEKA